MARFGFKVESLSRYGFRQAMSRNPGNGSLGGYLRERRSRLDPAALGFPGGRRRTPGLRREEVAQRAGISATWYSWLEQGRGGTPSAHALDRVSEALMLTAVEREHVFLLAFGRPPAVRYRPSDEVTPRLQYLLDALDALPSGDPQRDLGRGRLESEPLPSCSPTTARCLRRTATCSACSSSILGRARSTATGRASRASSSACSAGDAARVGAAAIAQPLVDELCAQSPDFAEMWREGTVNGACDRVRRLRHPLAGDVAFEFSTLSVTGRPDLAMLVYTPASADDEARVRAIVQKAPRTTSTAAS